MSSSVHPPCPRGSSVSCGRGGPCLGPAVLLARTSLAPSVRPQTLPLSGQPPWGDVTRNTLCVKVFPEQSSMESADWAPASVLSG